ncbi:MAG: winged helix-turn-helix domain-containing protein [Roseiflexaceae bacterium]
MMTRGASAPYTPTYRAGEMRTLAGWIASGVSGSVVGPSGCGRSNLLRVLCEHPAVLQSYLPAGAQPICLAPVDLYDLPSDSLADLYRAILHAFYWVRERIAPPLAEVATSLYIEHRAIVDPFLTQKAVYELLLAFQRAQVPVVLVMNRFDRFCETSSPQMVNTLRGLRDRFKETLSYIVGMRQEVAYLPDPAILGDMYELFDSYICYVGALAADDSRQMLEGVLRAAPEAPGEADVAAMLRLSGGFPSLLKTIAQWWMLTAQRPRSPDEWPDPLLDHAAIRHRLERLWQGLTQEEKLVLSEVHKQMLHRQSAVGSRQPNEPPGPLAVLERLAAKGCCVRDGAAWRVNGDLLAAFVARITDRIRGRIWLDEPARMVYQGQQPIEDLTPLEFNILRFLITHPHMRLTSDTIIDGAWPLEEKKDVVTPNNLQVHVSSIRKKIEPNPAEPRFLITWHGRPSGYHFFPEGKPE